MMPRFGFGATMVIIRPGTGVLHPAAFLVLGAAALFALHQTWARLLNDTDEISTTLSYTAVVGGAIMTAVVPFVWVWPSSPLMLAMFMGLGVFAAAADAMNLLGSVHHLEVGRKAADELRCRLGIEIRDERRERAVFQLAAEKLQAAETQYRKQRSEQIIRSATRKAVIGSLAAISPGTDILIQGYLGTQMVKALCELHDVPVREIELQKLLNLSQQQVRTALPLLLAVAGNAAKAFPGMGTLAGGLMHAVAYGLIFDALGRAVVQTLETRGELRPAPASLTFRDNLVADVDSQARKLLRLALDIRKEQGDNNKS